MRLPGHTSLRLSLAFHMITLMNTAMLPYWLSKKITEFELILFVRFSTSFHLSVMTAATDVTDIKRRRGNIIYLFCNIRNVWYSVDTTFRHLSQAFLSHSYDRASRVTLSCDICLNVFTLVVIHSLKNYLHSLKNYHHKMFVNALHR